MQKVNNLFCAILSFLDDILPATGIKWQEEVAELSKAILTKELTHTEMGTGNEKNRFIYVDMILSDTLLASKSQNVLRINIEKQLNGENAWCPIEFVVTGKGYQDLPIADIIEVKKEDFDQGRAQLYMQLFTAYNRNVKWNSKAKFPLFGAITNCQQWIFVRYDGKSFTESLPYFIKSSSHKKGLAELFDALVLMFKIQAKLCAPFVAEMKQ